MPEVDLTITISVIVALCAIVSPILTAIINNCHQANMKELEAKQKQHEDTALHEQEIFEDYLRKAGSCINLPVAETFDHYGAAYFVALLHADDEIGQQMRKANDYIEKENRQLATETLELIATSLHTKQQSK